MKKYIQIIKRSTTPSLLTLNLLTLWVYSAFHIKGETEILNIDLNRQNLPSVPEFSYEWLIRLGLIRSLFFFLFVLYPSQIWLFYSFLSIFAMEFTITLLWSFIFVGRLNDLFSSRPETDAIWFSGFWTLVFNIFYINYKINKINRYFTGTYEK
jgi:hypothetical protein